jgi:hypothetical protein
MVNNCQVYVEEAPQEFMEDTSCGITSSCKLQSVFFALFYLTLNLEDAFSVNLMQNRQMQILK